jgi:hypothetical protein
MENLSETRKSSAFASGPALTPERARLDREIMRRLGDQLRAHYEQLLSLPMPPEVIGPLTESGAWEADPPTPSRH